MTSIAIVGPTGVGKTYNSILWAHEQFNGNIFICRHLEDLKDFKEQEAIVFDYIDFSLIEPTQLIKLCDRDLHCSIRILKKIVRISPTVTKIFTYNSDRAFKPVIASPEQQRAINRRLTICRITKRKEVSLKLSEVYQKSTTKERSHALLQLLEQD